MKSIIAIAALCMVALTASAQQPKTAAKQGLEGKTTGNTKAVNQNNQPHTVTQGLAAPINNTPATPATGKPASGLAAPAEKKAPKSN